MSDFQVIEATQEEEELALSLQAQGPDEYPFGYYLHLAKEMLRESDATE